MGKFFKDWNKNSSKKVLLHAIQQRELPGAYGEPLEYFKQMDKLDIIEILMDSDKDYEQSSKLRPSKDNKFMGHTPNKRKTSRYT
tara:strand:+ start:757 stop:1011 length:255 start_codon:yes stop_codon:yes gene_type:complete